VGGTVHMAVWDAASMDDLNLPAEELELVE
jgi:hypothetical protein